MAEEKARTDRLSVVAKAEFRLDSLVGTYFLTTADLGWQGCVVAEPAPGHYLVELFSWVMGESSTQRLVRIDEMTAWDFYDDAEWMRNAYETGVKQRWAEQRAAE